jgi:UPF0176 protein
VSKSGEGDAAWQVDLALTGKHLTPKEFHAAVGAGAAGEREVVLVDVRNSFEHAIGHFEGAIEPAMKNFAAFPRFVDQVGPAGPTH